MALVPVHMYSIFTTANQKASLQTVVHRVHSFVGGVNHCSLHCRLAKFLGLMRRGKYGAVIGSKEPITWKFILGTYENIRFLTNHSAVFPPSHQTTEFRQMTV